MAKTYLTRPITQYTPKYRMCSLAAGENRYRLKTPSYPYYSTNY